MENKTLENLVEKIQENDNIIKKLVIYLESKNLLEDFYKKIYYTIEKKEPIYKIRYYKNASGKLLGLYDIKNSSHIAGKLERCSVYVYDEIRTLFFERYEINQTVTRQQEPSKSYKKVAIKSIPLSLYKNIDKIDLVHFIKFNPLLLVYAVANYSIDMNELDKINTKSYTYKKEIKKN